MPRIGELGVPFEGQIHLAVQHEPSILRCHLLANLFPVGMSDSPSRAASAVHFVKNNNTRQL